MGDADEECAGELDIDEEPDVQMRAVLMLIQVQQVMKYIPQQSGKTPSIRKRGYPRFKYKKKTSLSPPGSYK